MDDTHIPLVDLKAQYAFIREEVDAAIRRVLDSTNFILGPEVGAFERDFAAYAGAKQAVGVASGTAALHLALLTAGVGEGDEVITTPFTFFATGEAITQAGARPVFVDIDPGTYNIDPALVGRAVTKRTRAIIPVHIYGQPADMNPILDIARRHGLKVIEDAAQAHGAEYDGKRCGSLGDLGCFSFYPSKNLGSYGDAGMVTGSDPDVMARVSRLANHGRTSKYEHAEVGWGYRIDTIQAAILGVKLRHLDSWTKARRGLAARYNSLFAGSEAVDTPFEASGVKHVYHVYAVRTRRRDELAEYLGKHGVSTVIHYPIPLHLQPAYRDLGYRPGDFPVAEKLAREVLSLPLYPEMTTGQQDRVAGAVLSFFEGGK
jgi:dTDP-4-amino-4,6-dideoxygalactose transaminase